MSDCKLCVHKQICDLWRSQECQDASCFGNPCSNGCEYFTGWISVTEQLPEYVGVFLVLSRSGNQSVQWFHIHNGKKYFCDEEQHKRITHWMLLPESPKGE